MLQDAAVHAGLHAAGDGYCLSLAFAALHVAFTALCMHPVLPVHQWCAVSRAWHMLWLTVGRDAATPVKSIKSLVAFNQSMLHHVTSVAMNL
jgi:hypothetical protein